MRLVVCALLFLQSAAASAAQPPANQSPRLEVPRAPPQESLQPRVGSLQPEARGTPQQVKTMPYDEQADAAVAVAAAIAAAKAAGKLLLINFGANWCPDCLAFAEAMRSGEAQAVLAEHFVSVKVDVGNWDKHPEVVAAWGNPIEGGIPAVVVATPEREVLFSTKAGQLSKARSLARADFAAFFAYLASLAP